MGQHFLLVVEGTQLVGGLALEERHHLWTSIRMMGYGSASDHLDLLAAPGYEAAVVSLLGDWFRRPGGRLLDLKGVQIWITLDRSPAWPCSPRDQMAEAPFAMLPDSAEAYRSTLSSQFRRNLRRSADRLAAEGVTRRTIRGPAVLASLDTLRYLHQCAVGGPLQVSPRLRSLRCRMRRRCGGRRSGRARTRERRHRRRHRDGIRGGRTGEPLSERPAHRPALAGCDDRPPRRHHRRRL